MISLWDWDTIFFRSWFSSYIKHQFIAQCIFNESLNIYCTIYYSPNHRQLVYDAIFRKWDASADVLGMIDTEIHRMKERNSAQGVHKVLLGGGIFSPQISLKIVSPELNVWLISSQGAKSSLSIVNNVKIWILKEPCKALFKRAPKISWQVPFQVYEGPGGSHEP